jgi:hypothetical protein
MAFPGTYNFNYYRGDYFQFIIRPKNANGDPFSLDAYTEGFFTIANKRGDGATYTTTGTAVINTTDDIVTCTIPSATGANLDAGTLYYYDVQINSGSIITTLLTGTITPTDDITGATP